MSRDLTPLPLEDGTNGARMRTLVYDEADAPMLAAAMSLGAATSLATGGTTSINRFKHYQAEIRQFAHPGAAFMNRSTDLCEIAIIATAVPEWSIRRVHRERWDGTFRSEIRIGTRIFESKYSIDEEQHQAIVAMLIDVLPLTCTQVEIEDEDAETARW